MATIRCANCDDDVELDGSPAEITFGPAGLRVTRHVDCKGRVVASLSIPAGVLDAATLRALEEPGRVEELAACADLDQEARRWSRSRFGDLDTVKSDPARPAVMRPDPGFVEFSRRELEKCAERLELDVSTVDAFGSLSAGKIDGAAWREFDDATGDGDQVERPLAAAFGIAVAGVAGALIYAAGAAFALLVRWVLS